ncbi:MAG: TlpA disulfide reductase family protein, partial [Acidobacteriota bacterium]
MQRVLLFFLLIILSTGLLFLSACQPTQPPSETTLERKAVKNAPVVPNVLTNNSLEKIQVGQTIPEIKTSDINGQPIRIASREDAKGQMVVVYAPGCDVCHATIPRWNELYQQFFLRNNIPLIGLSVQNQADTLRSISELKIPFHVVVMPDIDLQFGYRVPDVPTTIILGADGSVKWLWVGQLGNQQLTEVIKIFCPECNVEIKKT